MREEVAAALTAPPMDVEDESQPAAPAPAPRPAPARAPAPAPPPAPEGHEAPAPVEPVIAEVKGRSLGARLLGVARVAPMALSWPLTFVAPEVRDQLGWFALVTAFNASAVWVFLLLRH